MKPYPRPEVESLSTIDWLARPRPVDARLRLVFFPHAGGAPSGAAPLAGPLHPDAELWVAQLPGRERRFTEPAATRLVDLVAPLGAAVTRQVAPPFVLFGHSMGALLAFEVARWLHAAGGPLPAHLVVSACQAPHLPRWRPARHTLDDVELRRWLDECGGLPPEVGADPQLLDLLLPTLRADLRACETHRYRPGPPVPCPITALAGVDDPLVSPADMAAWREHTTAEFALRTLPGGHFYYLTLGWSALADEIRDGLRSTGSRPCEVKQ